jgi:hypothetical protein
MTVVTVSGWALSDLVVSGEDFVAGLDLADRDGGPGGEQDLRTSGERLAAALLDWISVGAVFYGCGVVSGDGVDEGADVEARPVMSQLWPAGRGRDVDGGLGVAAEEVHFVVLAQTAWTLAGDWPASIEHLA